MHIIGIDVDIDISLICLNVDFPVMVGQASPFRRPSPAPSPALAPAACNLWQRRQRQGTAGGMLGGSAFFPLHQ